MNRHKRFFELDDFYDEDGNYRLTEHGLKNLQTLAEIVMNTHYSYAAPHDKGDLQQTGILKAIELLVGGRYDPSIACLKNYLYTGMRNEMKNYLYRTGKEVIMDDMIIASVVDDKTPSSDTIQKKALVVSDASIRKCLGRLLSSTSQMLKVKSTLRYMGYSVEGPYKPHYFPEVDREVCLIIWEKAKRHG